MINVGKDKGKATPFGGSGGEYHGKHRKGDRTPVHDSDASFRVESPEHQARGIGDQQTGGSRDE